MINISNVFREALDNDNRAYLVKVNITLSDGTELELETKDIWEGGLTIEDAVSTNGSLDVGAAIINTCDIVINNIYETYSQYDFDMAIVAPFVGLKMEDGTEQYIKKGTYIVDSTSYNESTITLSCFDYMNKFDVPYSESTLNYPASLFAIVQDACTKCGVILNTNNFPHKEFIVNERPEDEAITFRNIIGWAAQIAGCFCRCDTDGALCLSWYDQSLIEQTSWDGGTYDEDTPYSSGDSLDGGTYNPWSTGDSADGGTYADMKKYHHIFSIFSSEISTDDVVVTGVKVTEKAAENSENSLVSYLSGSDGYVVGIEDNELIETGHGEEIADWLGEQLIGLRFRKATITHQSDPTIEAGDVGFFTDRKQNTYPILISSTRFIVGNSQVTSSSAETPMKNSEASFSESTKNFVAARKETKKQLSSYDLAVQQLTSMFSTAFGLYRVEVVQPDGSTKYYMCDQPTLEESSNVWQFSAAGIMQSTDGGVTWAIDNNGNALFNSIMTHKISADFIYGGELVVGGVNNISGQIVIKDASGNEIGRWSKDGFESTVQIDLEQLGYTQNDVDRLRQIILGQVTPNDEDYERLDVNGDGFFDIFDTALIQGIRYGFQKYMNVTTKINPDDSKRPLIVKSDLINSDGETVQSYKTSFGWGAMTSENAGFQSLKFERISTYTDNEVRFLISGVSGKFTSQDGHTIEVTNGIITSIM